MYVPSESTIAFNDHLVWIAILACLGACVVQGLCLAGDLKTGNSNAFGYRVLVMLTELVATIAVVLGISYGADLHYAVPGVIALAAFAAFLGFQGGPKAWSVVRDRPF